MFAVVIFKIFEVYMNTVLLCLFHTHIERFSTGPDLFPDWGRWTLFEKWDTSSSNKCLKVALW